MSRPSPAVAATRLAVRADLSRLPAGAHVLVGCSGGPDSLALAAAVGFEAPRAGIQASGIVVDHDLQRGSCHVAQRAAAQCRELGLDPVEVVTVRVANQGDGPESAARRARYAALEDAALRRGADRVLIGHTRDDQAEQVLLGLARGSGPRSLSGMPRTRGLFVRPFIALGRADTVAACAAYGLEPWLDPQNADPGSRRVRARAVLGTLEAELGPGVIEALARSADMIREDADYLEQRACDTRAGLGPGPYSASALLTLPRPLRTRVWRLLALEQGSGPGSLTSAHVESLDALLTSWHGQGPLNLPGGVLVRRTGDRICIGRAGPVE